MQVFVPGCGSKDIRLRLSGNVLTVVASLPAGDHGIPLFMERETGKSERDFALASDLDIARLTRSLNDGVLTMIIPRHGALLGGSES